MDLLNSVTNGLEEVEGSKLFFYKSFKLIKSEIYYHTYAEETKKRVKMMKNRITLNNPLKLIKST